MDSVTLFLERLNVKASLFFAGSHCETTRFSDDVHAGHIHLFGGGLLTVRQIDDAEGTNTLRLTEPTLLLFARPMSYVFESDPDVGAELACANVEFQGAASSAMLLGFPDRVVLPLGDVPGLSEVLKLILSEDDEESFGAQAAVDRLVAVLLILVLRHCIRTETVDQGILNGLSKPGIAAVLNAINEAPGTQWNLEMMSDVAGMSRASFIEHFKDSVGVSPGDYLTSVRLSAACEALRSGINLKRVAAQVGYSSTDAFSRMFKQRLGVSPKVWLSR